MRPVKSTMPRGWPCGRHASPFGPADRSVTRPNAGLPLAGFAAAEDDAFAGGVLCCVFYPFLRDGRQRWNTVHDRPFWRSHPNRRTIFVPRGMVKTPRLRPPMKT
jgi:hypothetical protein